jgi:outer membrane protein TolC
MWTSIGVLLALAGCSTLSNARDAQDEKKSVPGERIPTAAELGLPTSGSITLEQVVSVALQAQPSVVQARHNAEAAEARVGEQEGAYFPQAATGPIAQYRYESVNSGAVHPQTGTGHEFQAFGFNVSWLIFDFGKTPALVRNAANASLAAQQDLRTSQVNTAFNVRSAYFNLAKQRELLQVATENVRDFEEHRRQVKEFFDAGQKRVLYDVTKADVDLGNAKLNEIKTRDALKIAQANLANAVGVAEITDWAPADGPPLPPFTLTFEEAWEQAREHQPQIAAARAREKAASDLVDAQIAALYPTITAVAGYNASGLTFPLVWNWSLGPNLNWVIFNGFTNYYTIDEAAANLRAARATRTEIEEQTWLTVRTAWVSLEDAKDRLDVTELEVVSAKELLKLTDERFKVGTATAVDYADAELSLVQAKSDNVQARADYETAIAQLWQALGLVTWAGRAP